MYAGVDYVPVLPAMGYGDEQLEELEELEATINAVDCDLVVTGTPDLGRVIDVRHPVRHAVAPNPRTRRTALAVAAPIFPAPTSMPAARVSTSSESRISGLPPVDFVTAPARTTGALLDPCKAWPAGLRDTLVSAGRERGSDARRCRQADVHRDVERVADHAERPR